MGDRQNAAALKGATRAFQKPPSTKPKPDLTTARSAAPNGALIAATRSWASRANDSRVPETASPLSQLLPSAIQSTPSIIQQSQQCHHSEPRAASVPRFVVQASDHMEQNGAIPSISAQASLKKPPALPAPRRSDKLQSRGDGSELSLANQIMTAAIDIPRPQQTVAKKQSIPVLRPESYRDKSMKMLSPHVTGGSLANAIVGANLAISRSPPKHRSPIPSPPRNRAAKSQSTGSRATSPRKGPAPMRQTLRNSESSSSEESGHRYRRPKRHPHKHHEAERKKWRDTLTDEELKRYAGWWAANRGWHVPRTCPKAKSNTVSQLMIEASYKAEDEVANVVVRDLWRRSRLSDQILMEIWELVDERQIGSLNKEQFIIGVWLIDQKLKGHKLPQHISKSAWQSVAQLNAVGVKIRVT